MRVYLTLEIAMVRIKIAHGEETLAIGNLNSQNKDFKQKSTNLNVRFFSQATQNFQKALLTFEKKPKSLFATS